MGSFLFTLVFFVIALAVLIAFHEFGHFWVARKLGVKVIRFSIGFGKPLWQYQRNPESTEYVVAGIPLGGYVKMVDEREEEVSPEDLPFAFNRQTLPVRTAIVLAGPLFNLMLAVLIFWVLLVSGESGVRPVLGEVESGTYAYDSGFRQGDELLQVSGESTPTWNMAMSAIYSDVIDLEPVDVRVRTQSGDETVRKLVVPAEAAMDPGSLRSRLGMELDEPKLAAVIEKVNPDSPAQKGGLKPGDKVVQANGKNVNSWGEWVDIVRSNPARQIDTVVDRDGLEVDLTLVPALVTTDTGEAGQIGASVRVPKELIESMTVEYSLGPVRALGASVQKVADFSWLTVKMMGRMLIGRASIENLSGPISIAKYAGESAALGASYFLKFLAIVSISLGVLNLMPVPMLDGGHLFFFLIEAIKGSPVSEQVQLIGQQVGIVLLFSLMGLAFFLDIERLLN